MEPAMDKPRKVLTGAVFIGNALRGDHPTKGDKVIRCSRVIARHSERVFETVNSIYEVEFVPKGETTIPEEWKTWPTN